MCILFNLILFKISFYSIWVDFFYQLFKFLKCLSNAFIHLCLKGATEKNAWFCLKKKKSDSILYCILSEKNTQIGGKIDQVNMSNLKNMSFKWPWKWSLPLCQGADLHFDHRLSSSNYVRFTPHTKLDSRVTVFRWTGTFLSDRKNKWVNIRNLLDLAVEFAFNLVEGLSSLHVLWG